MRQVLSQRVLQRTREWVKPTAQTKKPTANLDADAITKPLSEPYFELEKNTERTIGRGPLRAPKAKTKARGISQQSDDPVPEILERHLTDVQPSFHLNARAPRAFDAVFFTPSASSQQGELAGLGRLLPCADFDRVSCGEAVKICLAVDSHEAGCRAADSVP